MLVNGCVMIAAAPEKDFEPDFVRKYMEARAGYGAREDATQVEDEAYDERVLTPAEDALMAAVPTTREGVVAILDLAVELNGLNAELDWIVDRLVENARDAIKAGVALS